MHHPLSPLIELSTAQAADPAVTGSKFARLAVARDVAEIPAAWRVPVGWFSRALGPGRLGKLAAVGSSVLRADRRRRAP